MDLGAQAKMCHEKGNESEQLPTKPQLFSMLLPWTITGSISQHFHPHFTNEFPFLFMIPSIFSYQRLQFLAKYTTLEQFREVFMLYPMIKWWCFGIKGKQSRCKLLPRIMMRSICKCTKPLPSNIMISQVSSHRD